MSISTSDINTITHFTIQPVTVKCWLKTILQQFLASMQVARIIFVLAIMVMGDFANSLCEQNLCLPLDYNSREPPNRSPTVYVGQIPLLTYSLTEVNDRKFTLTLIAPFFVYWEDSRIKLVNFTSAAITIGKSLKEKIWLPEVFPTQLASSNPMHFNSLETSLCERLYLLKILLEQIF